MRPKVRYADELSPLEKPLPEASSSRCKVPNTPTPDLSTVDAARLAWIAAGPSSEVQRRAAECNPEAVSLDDLPKLSVGEEAQSFLNLDTRWFTGVINEDTTPFSEDSLRRLGFDLAEEAVGKAPEEVRSLCDQFLALARRQLAGELDPGAYKAARSELNCAEPDPYVDMCFEATLLPFCLEASGMTEEEYRVHRIFMNLGEYPPQFRITQSVVDARLKLALAGCGESFPGAGALVNGGTFRVEVRSRWLVGEDSERVDTAGLDALHGAEVPLGGVTLPHELGRLLGTPRFRFSRSGFFLSGRLMFESAQALTPAERGTLHEWTKGQLFDGLGEDLRIVVADREFHPWPVRSHPPQVVEVLTAWAECVEACFSTELARIGRVLLIALTRPDDSIDLA